jgi:hypothetical protein
VERDDQILHALREKDRTVQGLVEFTGIAESTVKRAIRELRSRGEVVLNADGTFRIRSAAAFVPDPRFLQIAENALKADKELVARLGDKANWNYRHHSFEIAVRTLAAAAKAGDIPQLSGMDLRPRPGRDQVQELRDLLIVAVRLLR